MVRLLVITPTLGRSPHLGAMCRSTAALGDLASHVVIGPSGMDGALHKAGSAARTLVETESRGLYSAINQAARTAGSREAAWITWINDDDIIAVDGIRRLLSTLEETQADIGYGRVRLIDEGGTHLGWLPVAHDPRDLASLMARCIMPLAQPGTIIRRSLFDELGGLDESFRLAADLDFFARALRRGARFGFVNQEVAAFRLHAGQLSKNEDEARIEAQRVFNAVCDAGVRASFGAILRFRWWNLGTYAGRIRRFGFRSMREVYRHS